MATVVVSTNATTFDGSMRLITTGLGTLRLPFIPEDIAVSGLAGSWEQVARPGRVPVLRRTGLNLASTRVSVVVWQQGQSIQSIIDVVKIHAESANPTSLILSKVTRGAMRITELSWSETDWNRDGAPIQATLDMTLTSSSDASAPIGPVPKPKPPKSKGKAKAKGKGKKKRGKK